MEALFGNVVNFVFVLIGVVIIVGVIARLCSNYLSREKEVQATVINKESYDKQIYKKSRAPFTRKEYVITFLCGGNKKKCFNVSELSYRNYKVNQKGTLKYKGNRIIDFN